MNYCSACAAPVERRVPEGDDRERHVCGTCGEIHYQNPRIIAGCLVTRGTSVLLARRAIEPRHGYWTLPAGFMENGESMAEGAARETWEEARAQLQDLSLYALYDIPHLNQVYVFYRAELAGDAFDAGPESLEVALFEADHIPWDALAFPVMTRTLEYWREDAADGPWPVRNERIAPMRRR